jgi:cytochrome c551/c552
MSRWASRALAVGTFALAAGAAFAQASFPGIGRVATPGEVAAWDIDVRADFQGLPRGSGSVAQGQVVWEAKCASCHGVFGESNQVFNPLVGGTTAEDVKTGRVANLARNDYPGRTTLMKLATVATLWDYIRRAMPWNQPKSLSTEEVYAVTAFMLNLAGVVPDDFTLSDRNIADVQQRMPNRNGMTTRHALWPGREFGGGTAPDVRNTPCMKDCLPAAPKVVSSLPDHARDAHGNLRDQNRLVGPQRGAETLRVQAAAANGTAAAKPAASQEVLALTQKYACTACHALDSKIVGPSFVEIAKKHAGQADYLASRIRSGSSGVWGPVPMPPQSLSEPEARAIAGWLAAGASR